MEENPDGRSNNLWGLVKSSFQEWSEDKAPHLAAALAYYTIFAIPPLLIIALNIAGQFLNRETARDQLLLQISSYIGQSATDLIKTMLENTSNSVSGLFATIAGIVILLIGASGVFIELQSALNMIWDVPPRPKRFLLDTLKTRLISFLLVLVIGFFLLAFLISSANNRNFK